jgi:hypothetical protein
MSGDTVGAAVAAIKNAETGTWLGNSDNDRINQVLSTITDPKQREAVRAQVGGELTKVQSGNDSKLTQALLAGDNATASAVKIDQAQHSWGATIAQGFNTYVAGGALGKDFGTDKDSINSAIEACKTPEERKKLQDAYKTQTNGTDLQKDLSDHLDGANKDVATKLLEGDTAAANAAKMKAATEHWFTDKDAIYKAMDGKPEAERKQMLADYNKMYGKDSSQHGQDVNEMLDANLSGLDRQKAQQLEDKGKLDDAFALKYAMEGSFWSTDKQLIKDTLAGKSKAEVDALMDKNPGLKDEITNGTSGRDGFEIKELMKGEPATLDEKVARSRERYDFERGSGSNPLSKAICDTFSDKGEMLDAQQQRMEDLYKKIQSGSASSEEKALLDRVTGYQNLDTKNYQESKDAVTNGAVAVAAVTAGAIATVATGGAAAPAEAAIIAALAAGGATIATKAIIQDSGYSNEELRNDIIMTGVNVATAGTMGALGSEGGALFNLAGKVSDNPMVQQAIIQGATGAVSTGVGNATQATISGKSMPEILKAGGMGALTGGAGSAFTGAAGAGLKGSSMFEGMDPMKAAMLRNGIAGAGGAAVSTALDPESYKGDSAALLMKWGTSVGGGALGGVAGGYNEGKVEVQNAKNLQNAEAEQQKTGAPPPTQDEQKVISNAKEFAENPAELKQVEKVEQQIKDGGTPKLPVEQDPTAVPTAAKVDEVPVVAASKKEDAPIVMKAEDAPVVAKPEEPVTVKKEEAVVVVEAKDAPVVAKENEPVVAKKDEPLAQKIEEKLAPAGKTIEVEDAVEGTNIKKSEEMAGPAKPAASDQGERDALVELSRQAKTDEERAQIAKWAEEIDAKNPKPMLDSLRELNIDARADGHLSPQEGSALKEWGHEGSLDRMPLVDAMHYEGMDKAKVQALFEKAELNDASHSVTTFDAANPHVAGDGTALAVPMSSDKNALTVDEMKMMMDIQGRRNDEIHPAEVTSTGRELEGTPMRKAVNEEDAAKYRSKERTAVGGDIGAAANTDGQHAERAAGTLGLDYKSDNNKYYDSKTGKWTEMITDRGLPAVEFELSAEQKAKMQVPMGQDAAEFAQKYAAELKAKGEYVPELFQGKDGEIPAAITVRDKESQVDPRTGFGFSATETATDSSTGQKHTVVPNQEHTLPAKTYLPIPDAEVNVIPPAPKNDPKLAVATAGAPEAAKAVTEEPQLAAKVQDKPETAAVVQAAPELAPEIAHKDSPIAAVADKIVEQTPALKETTAAPAKEAESLTPKEAFDLAQENNRKVVVDGKEQYANKPTSAPVDEVLTAAEQAKVGANPQLQSERNAFEKAIALSPEAQKQVQGTLDSMCQKALDYIQTMHGDNLKATFESLGKIPSERNYAGAVGIDENTIKAVLEGGNIRERMVALGEFQEHVLAKDALKSGGLDEMIAKFGGDHDGPFGAADIERLKARVEAYREKAGPDAANANALLKMAGPEHEAYATAKKMPGSGREMDTKLPRFDEQSVAAYDDKMTGPTKAGEASPFAKTDMTIADAQKQGYELSQREIDFANARNKGTDELPWVRGSVANMVDPTNPFIEQANAASMPLKAGISGTTFRALGLFETLGANMSDARLACLSQLNSIDAHSFHEIAMASNGFFAPGSDQRYSPAMPYTPGSTGLSPEALAAIAARSNVSLDDLNGVKPAAPAATDTHSSE